MKILDFFLAELDTEDRYSSFIAPQDGGDIAPVNTWGGPPTEPMSSRNAEWRQLDKFRRKPITRSTDEHRAARLDILALVEEVLDT